MNDIGNFRFPAYLLVGEHILMVTALVLVMYFGFSELCRRKSKVLRRVMSGYSVFNLCSLTTLVLYYFGASWLYSCTYVLGIPGLIVCLADAAWQAVLDGRTLDYLIVQHMEPDHAACISDIVLRHPELKILCSGMTKTIRGPFNP